MLLVPRRLVAFVLIAVFATAHALPGPVIDPAQVGVAGLSAGAFQAVQYAVAHSSLVSSLGVVAGGPFYCSQDQVDVALTACMKAPDLISLTLLFGELEWMATSLQIDAPKNIGDTRVYLYSGTKDDVVHSGVVKKLEDQLGHWLPPSRLHTQYAIPSVHSMVTDYTGHACDHFEAPFIVNCGYDQAGAMLSTMFGSLVNRSAPTAPPSKPILDALYELPQATFVPGVYTTKELSMGDTAYVYIPPQCTSSWAAAAAAAAGSEEEKEGAPSPCKLLVLLHGCEQDIPSIGMEFVYNTGVLQYAETNGIVILFPQVIRTLSSPDSCWDWYGYTGIEFPTKLGPQIATIHAMVEYLMRGAQ